MPRIYEPSPHKAGPGSALGQMVTGKRRRMKKKAKRVAILTQQQQKQDDGRNKFSWTESDEEEERKPAANVVSTVKKKKSGAILASSSDSSSDDESVQEVAPTPAPQAAALTPSTKSTQTNGTEQEFKLTKISNRAVSTRKKKTPTNKSGGAAGSSKKRSASTSQKKHTTSSFTAATVASKATAKLDEPALKPKKKLTAKLQRPKSKFEKSKTVPSMPVTTALSTFATSLGPESLPSFSAITNPHPSVIPRSRWAIGFDTRFIDTAAGLEKGYELIDESHEFVKSLVSRGSPPIIVVSSVRKHQSSNRRGKGALSVRVVEQKKQTDETMPASGVDFGKATPIWIPPPLNIANKVNRKAVTAPKQLLANDSWKHFGAMVESIIEADSESAPGPTVRKRRPLDITIVSSDLSLFCDTNDESHKRSVARFWDLVRPFFQDGSLRKIHIAVIKVGVIALAPPADEDDGQEQPASKESHNGSDVAEGVTTQMEEKSADPTQKLELTEGEARTLHEASVAKCIRALQSQLAQKAETDYKLHLRSPNMQLISPVDVSLTVIDATVHPRLGFKSLLRICLRDIVAATTAAYAAPSIPDSGLPISKCSPSNTIHLNLPATDDTQCSISLDVSYKILPFSMNLPATTAGFFFDLKELSSSKLDIVQLVPLSSVDASLLFGIPMSVRAALETDYDQYQEMIVMVRALFRKMQEKQVAMLLRITGPNDNNLPYEMNTSQNVRSTGSRVFHNPNRGQMFLLMAEEVVGMRPPPPSTGILFRYATAEDLLLEPDNPFTTSSKKLPEEVTQQYEMYVEKALSSLKTDSVNPLFLDATAPKNSSRSSPGKNSSSPHARLTHENDLSDNEGSSTDGGGMSLLDDDVSGGGNGTGFVYSMQD